MQGIATEDNIAWLKKHLYPVEIRTWLAPGLPSDCKASVRAPVHYSFSVSSGSYNSFQVKASGYSQQRIKRTKNTFHPESSDTMQCKDGNTVQIRKNTRPESNQQKIYSALGVKSRPGHAIKATI
jgi:hypothetical protein